jgi:hypothetical protein
LLLLACAAGLAWSQIGAARVGATCSCPPKPAPYAALADANLVFAGRVMRIEQPAPQLTLQRTPPFVQYGVPPHAPIAVTIATQEYWRGPVSESIIITTGRFFSSCGVIFREGGEYLIYAYYNGAGILMTHRCSRTGELQGAGEDLAQFGQGTPPVALPPAAPAAPAAALPAAIALALVCSMAWRRRQALLTTAMKRWRRL